MAQEKLHVPISFGKLRVKLPCRDRFLAIDSHKMQNTSCKLGGFKLYPILLKIHQVYCMSLFKPFKHTLKMSDIPMLRMSHFERVHSGAKAARIPSWVMWRLGRLRSFTSAFTKPCGRCLWTPAPVDRWFQHPIIYKLTTIPGGAGFRNHPQYVVNYPSIE